MGYGGKPLGFYMGNGRRTNRAEAVWEDIYQSGKGIRQRNRRREELWTEIQEGYFMAVYEGRFFDERVFSW